MSESDIPAADTTAGSEAVEGAIANGGGGDRDWREGIADTRLRDFAGRFASPADAVKAAFDLRRKLSADVVPEGPDGYALSAGDEGGSSAAEDTFRDEVAALFHDARMTLPQAAALERGWRDIAARTQAAQAAADVRALTRAERELRREWGADYERHRAMAERAVAQFHDGDAKELLNLELRDGRLLGSLPSFVRYAAKVGAELVEDTLHADTETASGASFLDRIDEIHGWQHASDPALRARYRAPDTQAELSGLYKRLHGEGPVVGGEGRRT
jgi:hypothetical protein